jgi:hypothetical protein
MSLSPKNLSSVQKAGQAVHDASEAIGATVRTQAESMVASMSTSPFSAESEQAISRFKTLSKLSQGLAAVEAQLQELYVLASDLASSVSDVIGLPSTPKRKAVTNAAAVDVVAKPPKAAKKVKKGGRQALALTANDSKLLGFLQGALKGGAPTVITGNKMSDGSDIPLGSVGISLKKIIATGALKQVGRGTYQLLGSAAAPAAEPVVKSAPTKKVKPAMAKKAKAIKAEVPPAKEVKAKPAKKVKASVSKKVKAVSKSAAPVVVANEPAVEAEAAPV